VKLREEFLRNRDVTDTAKLTTLVKGIYEIEDMLRHNVVQVNAQLLHSCSPLPFSSLMCLIVMLYSAKVLIVAALHSG
jgi:hypothetical protein